MGQYILKKDRAKFIENNFFEWMSFERPDEDVSDEEPFSIHIPVADREKFDSLSHPAELHYLASIYNWDDGPSVLEWVVDSPLCSKATANLIFWRAVPDDYMHYGLNEVNPESDYDEGYEVLRVLRKIIEKHKNNNFSSFKIAFDPAMEIGEIHEENPKWSVPAALYEKIDGATILVESQNRLNVSNIVKVFILVVVLWLMSMFFFH